MFVPRKKILPNFNNAKFQEMIEEAKHIENQEKNEVRDVLKNSITDMKDRLQANKLFMNMVIHDLRSPSENI
jgi:hypothetical protein